MAIELNSGFKMPIVGLGVWRMEGKDIKNLLIHAIKIGYRHFDCAGTSIYLCTFSEVGSLFTLQEWIVDDLRTKLFRTYMFIRSSVQFQFQFIYLIRLR